jgi:hypothetical protein
MAHEIKKLRLMQCKYSPVVLQRLATAAPDTSKAECTPLLLPSALSPSERLPLLSVPELAAGEARLRYAQCGEALDVIRHGLSVKKQLHTYKSLNSRRQHQSTRSRTLIDTQQRKVELAVATYRQARLARLVLADVAGSLQWCQLDKANVRMMEDEEEAKRRK